MKEYDFAKGKKNPYLKGLNKLNEQKDDNVVLLSKTEFNAMMETIYLMSAPGVHEELKKAKKSKPSEYVKYDSTKEW